MIGGSGVVATVVVSIVETGVTFVVVSILTAVVSGRAVVSIFIVVSIWAVVSTLTTAVSAGFGSATSPAAESFLSLIRCVEVAVFFVAEALVFDASLLVVVAFFVLSGY